MPAARPVPLPPPRGALTEHLFTALQHGPYRLGILPVPDDVDDLQLALYCCYELAYRGFADIDPEWEWEPSLLALRRRLEQAFIDELQCHIDHEPLPPAEVVDRLWAMADGDGRSLSGWVAEHATEDHLRELAILRSAYQLKEADPHTWCIPRLAGPAKAVMVAIQTDEYGNGDPEQMHSSLFADTMTSLGLDPTPNLHLDHIPGTALATVNLISLFGLHRRWRGALVGHLALFEMTSIAPMSRYGKAFRRLGFGERATRFYDVHVQVDAVHEKLAADGMVAGLLEFEPDLAGDVIFGAAALNLVEGRLTDHILDRWVKGESALRPQSPTKERQAS